MPVISLAAEKIGSIGGFPISNSLLATWVVMLLLFVWAWRVSSTISLVPGRLQSITELIIGGLYDFFAAIAGHHITKFFPLVASLFIFIMSANWFGLLPGVGTVGLFHTPVKEEVSVQPETTEKEATYIQKVAEPTKEGASANEVVADTKTHSPSDEIAKTETAETVTAVEEQKEEKPEFIPLLRASNADLNTTLALAIIAVLAIQYFGFSVLGVHYGQKFLNFKDPIQFVLGILESISELSRIISFAFRLFGNIFAGEVLLAVMAFLMPFIVPLPFLLMELFVGFIQALVFSMLTTVFLNLAVSHGEE